MILPQEEPTPSPAAAQLLLDALDQRYEKYCAEREHCRSAFSEEAVHDLRVSARRLLALIILLKAVCPHPRLQKLRRALKEQLDSLDDLRDTQVMLARITADAVTLPALAPLEQHLRKREARLLKQAGKNLTRTHAAAANTLNRRMARTRSALLKTAQQQDVSSLLLKTAREGFDEVLLRIAQVDANQPASIHRVRIKFKAFRYIIEIIHPLLAGFNKEQFKAMQGYQTGMGEIQDAEVLLRFIHTYTQRHPKFNATPALAHYQLRHSALIHTYMQNMGAIHTFWNPRAH